MGRVMNAGGVDARVMNCYRRLLLCEALAGLVFNSNTYAPARN